MAMRYGLMIAGWALVCGTLLAADPVKEPSKESTGE